MLTPLTKVYPNNEPYEIVVFDLLDAGACESLHRQRAAWQERCDIEALDENHFILIVRPGGLYG
jgi:hypothetical protein